MWTQGKELPILFFFLCWQKQHFSNTKLGVRPTEISRPCWLLLRLGRSLPVSQLQEAYRDKMLPLPLPFLVWRAGTSLLEGEAQSCLNNLLLKRDCTCRLSGPVNMNTRQSMKGCLSWDFCNKMLLTRWLHQQKLTCHSSGGWSPRSDASLAGLCWVPSSCLQIWLLSLLCPQWEFWWLFLFLEGHWSYQEGSTPGPQQNETWA